MLENKSLTKVQEFFHRNITKVLKGYFFNTCGRKNILVIHSSK